MTETLGKHLVDCRQRKGMTVEEISQVSRINSRLIKLAEEDRFDRLPGTVFIKGMLRSYAKVVGIDGEDLVKRFDTLKLAEIDRSPKLISMPLYQNATKPAGATLGVAVAFALVLAAGYFLDAASIARRFTGEVRKPAVVNKAAVAPVKIEPIPAPAAQEPATVKEEPADLARDTADTKPADAIAEEEPAHDVAEAPAAMAEETPQPTPEATAERPDVYQLTIHAESDSWIRAEIDDETTKEIILRGGKYVDWTARKGYVISIGNVAGTRIFLNGEEIELEQPVSNVITNLAIPASDTRDTIAEKTE